MTSDSYPYILVLLFLSNVLGQDNYKSSLTFVIDDTGSMYDDIAAVKTVANAIFDTVLYHNSSQIENVILVTFNDPTVQARTVTKDRDEFQAELSKISVNGGGDCPEYSMSGIRLALELSLPQSYIYVFTDATASDYKLHDEVQSLATLKQSQVVFVLTGNCGNSESSPDYKVYYELAKVTYGEVFNVKKQEVKLILDYVINSINGRTPVLAHVDLPPGVNIVIFTADAESKDPTISLATVDRDTPTIDITAPDGNKPLKRLIVQTDRALIYEVYATVPGEYAVKITSKSRMRVVVKARSDFTFQHGFSILKPLTIDHTSTRPAPDVKSHMSIKLLGGEVELKAAKLFDMSAKKIMELPLELSDEKTKFYVTEPFNPPKTMFRLAVIGYHPKSATNITRFAPTAINPTLPVTATIDPKAPTVVIDGEPNILAEYDKPLKLFCNVIGYPKANIVWKNKGTGSILNAEMSLVELPYKYLSVYTIDKVNKNATYECEGSSTSGSDSKTVAVVVHEPERHFIVKNTSKIVNVEYEKEGKIFCIVDAYPPAQITWYRGGIQLISEGNIDISPDNSTVTFKNTTLYDIGAYICEARNEDDEREMITRLRVVGLEAPVIDKHIKDVTVIKGSSAVIECKILQGKPRPTITWRFRLKSDPNKSNIGRTLDEWFNQETITVNNATKNYSGIYECQAENDISDDIHQVDVIVEYPPKFEENVTLITAKTGSKVVISCNVDGVPTPNVSWFKDDMEIKTESDSVYKLRLSAARSSDSGYYTCKATNNLGTATRKVKVEISVPLTITPPFESDQTVLVNTGLSLPCEADGNPKPEIKWIYHSFSRSSPSMKIIRSKGEGPLNINRIQLDEEGFYTCVASNSEGSKNISYAIKVFEPPTIEEPYSDDHFVAVEGDLALRITCNASGIPKPVITWSKNGWKLASGPPYYILDETLLIVNVPKDASGIYKCEAENSGGTAQKLYEVSVKDFPPQDDPTSAIIIEKGKPQEIECDVPHESIDQLRWYKNEKLIQTGELKLTNPSVSDSGHYTCRVSDFIKSANGNIRVDVGYKPVFKDDNIETVDPPVSLDCSAFGIPEPQVAWYLDNIRLNVKDNKYELPSNMSVPGRYRCEVKNSFGIINRTYIVNAEKCFLDTNKLSKLQPLMVTSSLTWPTFERSNNFIIFPKGEQLVLFCPSTFKMFPNRYIRAFCEGGMNIMIRGEHYNYSEIQCKQEVTHVVQRTGEKCLPGNTEKIKIVYQVLSHEAIEAYEVCLDKDRNVPLYAMYKMKSSLADNDYKMTWSDSEQFHMNFEYVYNCKSQIQHISRSLRRWFHIDDQCCFTKRQLVNPRDVFPGVAQKSTYSYFNVVPQWSTCNAYNWDDVEARVRGFAKRSYEDIIVWTGTAKELYLPTGDYITTNMFFGDRRGNSQPVAMFLWKVIQDPASESSLAIIQVNVPDLTPLEVSKYTLCEDICDRTNWMKSSDWHNITRGYTYCCSLPDFERSFGFTGVFNSSMGKVLDTVNTFDDPPKIDVRTAVEFTELIF